MNAQNNISMTVEPAASSISGSKEMMERLETKQQPKQIIQRVAGLAVSSDLERNSKIDFSRINAAVLPRLGTLLPQWLPGGRVQGGEYICASLQGGPGRSCSVNLSSGAWADFATEAKGGDPISLWAAIRGIKQGEAARELARDFGLKVDKPVRRGRGRIVASYDYLGPDRKLVFQVTRWEPKTFTQRRPDGDGGWINSVKDIELVPYHLPEILTAEYVFIVEGEKDADALVALGLTATCNAQGAGKWRSEYNRWFAGKKVYILPDNDDPGQKHAQDVARHLSNVAEVVKIINLPGLQAKGDVSDWLKTGGSLDALLKLVETAPAWDSRTEVKQGRNGKNDYQEVPNIIRLEKGALGQAVDACEAVLARADLPTQYKTFQRGGQLVRVASLPTSSITGSITRPQGAIVILEAQKPFLLDTLGRFSRFEKFDARTNGYIPADPPKAVVDAILARAGMWPFLILRGVVACPTLRPDVSLVLKPGYDPVSGYYLDHNLMIEVPDSPSRADAQAALKDLTDLLSGFSFVDAVDCAVGLSLIVSAVVRPALAAAPLIAITAPTRGSGKSTLMDIAAIISTGRRSAVLSATSDKDELEKRLAGCLLSGDGIISLDNINGILGSDLLCQAITSEAVKVRPLGTSSQVEIPNTAMWSANGNNLSLTGDLSRRALLCRLDPGVERPEERTFSFDPLDRALRLRDGYVTAVLTIVRAYIAAGCPDLGLKPFGSFEQWSILVRSALIWAGATDPCESREAIMEDDPEAVQLRKLLTAWDKSLGRTPLTAKELATIGDKEEHPLAEIIREIGGEGQTINTRRLGKWLGRHAGRIVNGLKLIQHGEISGVNQWKVVRDAE